MHLLTLIIYCITIVVVLDAQRKLIQRLILWRKFTIVVPFRNEADNFFRQFSKLNYPNDLFEVILVDDESRILSVSSFSI
jgi:cellulose synthase/poly-beta-1,6-N-acetylglucosamine synthase-like glycosyltransferase